MQSCRELYVSALQSRSGFWGRLAEFTKAAGRMAFLLGTVLFIDQLVPCPFALAQEATTIDREYTIKAAFLYHFLTYIDWPEGTFNDAKQPFVIGVFGTDPFGAVLDKIAATKNVEGRSIEIRRLSSTDKLLDCHIVFVATTVVESAQLEVLALLANSHVLCVGETENFVQQGGAAQFFVEGNKVRFAFNTDVVDRSNLKVSSKLLALAKLVSN